MAELTDEELREAAAEAGISPNELRHALAVRAGTAGDNLPATSALGDPVRGMAARFTEGRIRQSPPAALGAVRASIERQIGKSGHNQGPDEADIVDDDVGVTYRIRSRDDGDGGALVRVDIDPSAGRGMAALRATSVTGVTVAMVGLAWLLSSTLLWLGALGMGAIGGLLVVRSLLTAVGASKRAVGVAAQALNEADESAIAGALPPGR
jgi:hypothetical protein